MMRACITRGASVRTICWILGTISLAAPGHAQDAGAAQIAANPASTAADSDDEASGQIEDILVTATRREERLQDVPISITALSSETLVASGITTTADLGFRTPGLVITSQNGALTPFLRGVGSGEASAGQEAAVATYVDGVYIAAPYGITLGLNNVERVEVLKGPQGTLFGRNASGGLIHIITRDPKQDASIEARVSYGNYDTVDANLYATTGIAENLATDISVYYHNQTDGYGRNVTTGNETNKSREFAVRNKWMFTPGERTTIKVAAEYSNYDYSLGSARQLLPGAFALDGLTTYTGNYYDVTGNIDANLSGITYGFSGHITQEFDPFSVVSITSYRNTKQHFPFDNDLSAASIFDVDIDNEKFRTFTQELQLVSGPDSPFKWIVGAYYLHDKSGYEGPLGVGIFGAAVGGGLGVHGTTVTRSYAGFAEATVGLGSATNLTVGGRYTIDKRKVSGFLDVLNPATRLPVFNIPTPTQKRTYKEPTYRVLLDHHFTPDIMAYGSYSRGFKSGNFQTTNTADPAIEPEINDAFEVGFKSDLAGRTLRLNGALFYYKYKNIQLPVVDRVTIRTINAADSVIKGAELESQLNLGDYFSIAAGIAYLDTEIKSFPNPPCFLPNPRGVGGDRLDPTCNVVGNRLPKSPKFTLNLAPTVTIPVSSGVVTATASYQHTSRFFWDTSNARRLSSDPQDILNARLGWTSEDEHLGIAVFARNLLDEEYPLFIFAQLAGEAFAAAPPRTYGLEVSMKF